MLLKTREEHIGYTTGITTREIARTSRLVSRLTGYAVQPNKAIVGRNAFQHESGIHQDGVLKHRQTYEIMDATTIGLEGNDLVLGKHSGRHAIAKRAEVIGRPIEGDRLAAVTASFKQRADLIGEINDAELIAIIDRVDGVVVQEEHAYAAAG